MKKNGTIISSRLKEYLFYIVLFISFYLLLTSIDFYDSVYEFTRSHEDMQLDELLSMFPVLSFIIAIYAMRRSAEVRKLNRALEEKVAQKVAEIREKDKAIIEQSRHAALGEMIQMIAHQWRQPLNSIVLIFSKLQMASELGKLNKEMINDSFEKADKIAQQMSKTIDDFRNFYKTEKAAKDFSLQECVDETIALIEPTMKATGINITTKFPDSELKIHGVKNELMQVFLNMLGNAKHAMDSANSTEKEIVIEALEEDGILKVSFEDSGGGISEEIIDKIFDPYFTTKHSSVGTGLGLSMSKMIIEQNFGGKINVKNSSKGACFMMEIPLT